MLICLLKSSFFLQFPDYVIFEAARNRIPGFCKICGDLLQIHTGFAARVTYRSISKPSGFDHLVVMSRGYACAMLASLDIDSKGA
jgi:hypothetical protein